MGRFFDTFLSPPNHISGCLFSTGPTRSPAWATASCWGEKTNYSCFNQHMVGNIWWYLKFPTQYMWASWLEKTLLKRPAESTFTRRGSLPFFPSSSSEDYCQDMMYEGCCTACKEVPPVSLRAGVAHTLQCRAACMKMKLVDIIIQGAAWFSRI